MPFPITALVIEDNASIRLLLRRALESAGFGVIEAVDGQAGLDLVAAERPAVVVLDVGLPVIDGIGVVTRLREGGNRVPVLMLTSYADVEDRLRGLAAGADDYLGKPFDHREVTARVRALLRREVPATAVAAEFRVGSTTVNLADRTACGQRGFVALTKTEFAILECLVRRGSRPLSREDLLRAVWGYENATMTRTAETHIWRLRKKLGDNGDGPTGIFNRSGLGYVLVAEATSPRRGQREMAAT